MLPDDTKACQADLYEKLQQMQVNDYFDTAKPEDKLEPYSDALFKEAVIQWLVKTDQVCKTSMSYFSIPNIIQMLSLSRLLSTCYSRT